MTQRLYPMEYTGTSPRGGMPVAKAVSSIACRGGSKEVFEWLVAAGVDIREMPDDGRLFCADDCKGGLPGNNMLENPSGIRCHLCYETRRSIVRTLSTLVESLKAGAYSMGVGEPLPLIPTVLPGEWARKMVVSPSGPVHAPLLYPNMRFVEHRNTLANLFSAWMISAQQAPPSSPQRTMIENCSGLYFGVTSDIGKRHQQHASSWGKGSSAYNMLGMVCLTAGIEEDKNDCWENSTEGTLRLRAEQEYPELIVVNKAEDDMQGQKARSHGIVCVKSWSEGGAREYAFIQDCRMRGINASDRGSGVVRLVRQLAWGSDGTMSYMLLLQRKNTQ